MLVHEGVVAIILQPVPLLHACAFHFLRNVHDLLVILPRAVLLLLHIAVPLGALRLVLLQLCPPLLEQVLVVPALEPALHVPLAPGALVVNAEHSMPAGGLAGGSRCRLFALRAQEGKGSPQVEAY